MNIGTSYRREGAGGVWDAIVIGSGIGGLAAAALLARHGGRRVLVLERHYTAGGFTHVFRRPGYEWDVGVHYIGQTQPHTLLRRAFDEVTGGALAWADMGEVYDTIVVAGDAYELHAGRDRWRAQMGGYFPKEGAALDRYLELIKEAARSTRLFFAEKVLPAPVARLAGGLMRRKGAAFARRTTAEVLAELTPDRRLRAVLAGQYGDYGLPPRQSSFLIHALVVNHYLSGGAYPVGGASRIAATILPLIEEKGGKVLVGAEVERILVEGGRALGVRLADGVEVRAPLVISDAGAANTFLRLLPPDQPAREEIARSVRAIGPSVAHASLYLGYRRTAADLGLTRSNVWVYPGDDHDESVARFLADPEAPLPVAYLSFPSAKDPDFERRHPGRATVEVVALAPYDGFRRWEGTRWKKRGDDYEAFKGRLQARLLDALHEQRPALRGQEDHVELSTPLSTRHFAGFAEGEIYGLAHTPARFAARWLRPRTPVRGLYLTGADICTAGVGGALFGGILTASAVLKRNLLAAIARRPAGRGDLHTAPSASTSAAPGGPDEST